MNRLLVRCAEDVVFYRDEHPWVRRFIEKNRQFRVDHTVQKFFRRKRRSDVVQRDDRKSPRLVNCPMDDDYDYFAA